MFTGIHAASTTEKATISFALLIALLKNLSPSPVHFYKLLQPDRFGL